MGDAPAQSARLRSPPLTRARARAPSHAPLPPPSPRCARPGIGCSRDYVFPEELNGDYGTPVDKLCKETTPGVFTREWTKASVQLDCKTFAGTTPPM